MMIRPAKFADILRIVELLDEMCLHSKYNGVASVSHKAAHRLLQQCIQRHGFTNDGGSFVMVAVRDQRVEGFMVGILDRVYHVTDMLAANDVFLYCTKKAHPTSGVRLFDAYVSWAKNNPKVVSIKASWTDAMAGSERIERMYEGKGFKRSGGIFEMIVEPEDLAMQAAAALVVERVLP